MAENTNFLGTPENYATPDQLASMNAYSRALLENSMKPIQHWTQGLQRMVEALVGGNQSWNANQKKNAADKVLSDSTFPATGAPAVPFSPSLSPAGNKTTGPVLKSEAPSEVSSDVLSRAAKATAKIESGDNYAKLGPVIDNPKSAYAGDRAYGKYQVMGKNVPEWTAKYAGRSMTPDEFVASPEAQEAVYKGEFGRLAQKYGPEGAARAWFAGEGGMNDPTRKDVLGTTVAEYGKRFSNAYAPEAAQPPIVQAMAKALNPQMAENTAAASGPGKAPSTNLSAKPDPSAEGIYINPALVPRRPQLTENQLRSILGNPTISEQAKQLYRQEYINRDAPIDVPYPGGVVRIDPRNPTVQQFIPEAKWGKTQLGDMHKDVFLVPDGRGGVRQAPTTVAPSAVGPRSEAPSPAAPVAPAGVPAPAAPAGRPAPVVAAGISAGGGTPNAPAPATTPSAAPVQVASTDPASGTIKAAQVSSEPPLTQWAQARPPGTESANPAAATTRGGNLNLTNFTPDETADYEKKAAFDLKTKVDEEAQKKGVELAMKKYDTLSTQAQSARKLRPNLDLALSLIEDPNFSSGLLHGVKDTWQRLKEATGIEKMSNAPNEAFDKLMAGTVLDTMKTTLAGLGQVRLAEIDLLNRANGNRNNGVASNRAVLDISRRAVEKVDQLDSIAQQYMSGDEVTDPITGNVMLKANLNKNGEIETRRGLDAGFDKLARKFTNDHPSFTPEEIKNYHSLFEGKLDPNTGQPKVEGAGAVTLPPEAVQQLKAGTVTKFNNGQSWTLGSDGKPKQVK